MPRSATIALPRAGNLRMNWVDYLIIGVVAVSALISLVRGFVREAISIAVWVAAFWLAIALAPTLAGALARYIASPMLQLGAAFAMIFVGTLLAGALIGYFAGVLVGRTGLTGTDRAVGVLFGAARGLILVGLLVLALGLTRMPEEGWWQESEVIGWMQPLLCRFAVGEWMREFVVYSPVARGAPNASGRPAADYWAEFCRGAR